MSKKEFAWDSEVLIKTIELSEYEKREVKICELNGKQFVSFTTVKKIKDEWKPCSGYTVPKSIWCDVVEAVSQHDLAAAFDGIGIPTVEAKPKKTRAKKSETAATKETKAKKTTKTTKGGTK